MNVYTVSQGIGSMFSNIKQNWHSNNNKITNIIYVLFTLFLGILIIPDDNNNNLLLLGFITALWSFYYIYLKTKKHTLIAINASILFWSFSIADVVTFQISAAPLIAYSFFIISFSFIFVMIFQGTERKIIILPSIAVTAISIFLYSIPILYIVYYFNFGVYVTPEIIHAILQTNISEAIEFISGNVATKWLVIIFTSIIVLTYYMYKFESKKTHHIGKYSLIFLILIPLSISLADKKNLRIIHMLTRTISHYGEDLKKFKEVQEKRKSGVFKYNATKNEKGETYIVIIGESLNKNHMSLYGYTRETTPRLKKNSNELIVFENAYSNHTHTMPTLSQALTESNQYNEKNYYDSLSIIDILNKAKVQTYWITNQVLQGSDDNLVGVIATQANELYRINHEFGATDRTRNFDGKMIKIVENILMKKDANNKVLFVHLMGNHGDYCLRYPEKFNKYDGPLPIKQYGFKTNKSKLSKLVNCYDNSVLYNDYVVSSIINKLSLTNHVSGLIYLSDHAEDVLEMRGHNSGMFTFDMTGIPMLMWFSQEYKTKYKSKFNELLKHKNNYFSNDLIYDTLIGIMNIDTLHVKKTNDLSNPDFNLPINKAYTLHGKMPYDDSKNYKYWISKNIKLLHNKNLSNRILPHRVNSTGKLSQVLHNKYRSLELDIIFKDDDKGGYFVVGHDKSNRPYTKLIEYLDLLPINKMQKIWLDLKNLDETNIINIRKRLNYLDKKYHIKNMVILESETTLNIFSKISDDGFHTSYYLPGDLAKLYRKNKIEKLREKTKLLIEQIKRQHCNAISFDISLYPYVKEYLDKKLDKDIIYHTWDLTNKLKNKEFFNHLKKKKYFNDDRINTILVTYYSEFNL